MRQNNYQIQKCGLIVLTVLGLAPFIFAGKPQLGSPALNKVKFHKSEKHDPLQLVADGKLNFVILYDKKAEAHLSHNSWKSIEPAVKTLKENIQKATGTEPEIADIAEAEKFKNKLFLLVGESALTKKLGILASSLPQEGFVIKSFPNGIAIVGNDSSINKAFNTKGPMYNKGAQRATLWGAYDFLERFFGCRFYYPGPDGSVHPKVNQLEIESFFYTDAPHFKNRGGYYLQFDLKDAEKTLGKLTEKDRADYYASQRKAKCEPFTSMHSPYPIPWAKANPEMIPTSFFRNSTGHLYQSYTSHAGNYFDVTSLKFADNLIDSLKRYYASNGKEKQGWGYNNGYYVVFGQADMEVQLHEMQNNETVKRECLITQEDIQRGSIGYFSNIYARFYKYLAERIKKEFPGRKLIIINYGSYVLPPSQKKYYLPDNVETAACLGKFPRFVQNPEVRKDYLALMKGWYEALGNRPVQQLWTYNCGNNCFAHAVATEKIGEMSKCFGKYLGNVEIFHEFGMFPKPFPEVNQWHFNYETYAGMRAMWNPDFDVDAALDEYWILFYGPKAGPHLKKLHDILNENFLKYGSAAQKANPLYPPVALDKIAECLNAAEKELAPGTIERRRYDLMAKPLKFELKSQRGRHAYNAPVYNMHQLPAEEKIVINGKGDELCWLSFHPCPCWSQEAPERNRNFQLIFVCSGMKKVFMVKCTLHIRRKPTTRICGEIP